MTEEFLVPPAQRVFEPSEHQDSSEETIWLNPTTRDAKLDLYVETPKPGKRPTNWEEKTGNIRLVIRPGQTRSIDSKFDRAIQHWQCMDNECLGRPFECKNPEHAKQIVGGLGPQLVCKGTQRRPMRPASLHPALDDVEARKKAAEQEQFQAFLRSQSNAEELKKAQSELLRVQAELEDRKRQLETLPAAEAGKHAPAKGKDGK